MPHSLLAIVGSLWAAFLLPPQLYEWSGSNAPSWALNVADAGVYEWWGGVGKALGVEDAYIWFGASVGLSFLLIGLALHRALQPAGAWGSAVAWLTLLGSVAVAISYPAAGWDDPWGRLWGVEGPLLILIALLGLVAGVAALRRERKPRAWMILAMPLAVVGGTVAFGGYYPHATLVGLGIYTAILTWPPRTLAPPS